MKLQQLRHFVTLVECKTMRAASQKLGLSQPALSRSIQTLEKSLDISLFRREPRRVILTAAGAAFYRQARLVLSDTERARHEVLRAQEGVYFGEVSIGLAGMFATYVADEAIATVLSNRPNLRVHITEGLFEDALADLELGRLDLMFSNFPRVKVHPDIKLEPLVELHHSMLVRSDHPLARKRREVTLADLLDERWLLIDQVHASLNFEGAFERADLAPPDHLLKTNSLTLIRSLMREGNHVACMPEEFFERELREGLLKRLNVPQFTFPRRAGLLYRGGAYQTPAVVEVMDALRAAAARPRGQR